MDSFFESMLDVANTCMFYEEEISDSEHIMLATNNDNNNDELNFDRRNEQ